MSDPRILPLEGTGQHFPEFAALHELRPERYPFLLQSTATSAKLGRSEMLFAFPGDAIELSSSAGAEPDTADGSFLGALDAAFARERVAIQDEISPFRGGWFLYLGYELAAEIEPGLDFYSDPLLPRAFAVRCPAALIRDLDTGAVSLMIEAGAEIDVASVRDDLAMLSELDTEGASISVTGIHEEPPEVFLQAVETGKRHIARGDIYQANLSREWRVDTAYPVSSAALFRRLARANPAPFAGLLRWGTTSVVSSSPERLVNVRGRQVSTRPIAGTRPRSGDPAEDESLRRELLENAKERSEHVMLIDLERNDLGRLCAPGSVEVDEFMVLESYAHVHHIVSNVRGDLRDDVSPGQVIAAVFPGGTITGCPKVRCMQIIGELEASVRGAYTGSFGYLNRDGTLDLNILIRSIVLSDTGATFRAGSGIVADSIPAAELEETRAKAKGMLRVFLQ
ncbi:MAG: aminodeoxychorismate synthase component I [Pseudomonadota bacterium]